MFKNIPPITKNLLIINLIIFMAQLVGEQRGFDLTRYFGLHFILADHFMPHQLVSYLFLHANFSHLFFNMFSLWMFGCIIERTMGFRRFLTYYFVCGIGAGLCQELWQYGEYLINGYGHYDLFNIGGTVIPASEFFNLWNTVGASGACYGVLLAFGMTFPNERIMLLIPPIPMKAKYFVVAYAAIELVSAFASNGNIAHFAHLGGMLFGLLLILYWRRRDRRGTSFNGWENWRPRQQRSFMERIKDAVRRLFTRRPKMKVSSRNRQFKDHGADYDYNIRQKEQQERIDRILDKVRRSGYESLTADEKRELFNNSRR